jgi:hypothetical protein
LAYSVNIISGLCNIKTIYVTRSQDFGFEEPSLIPNTPLHFAVMRRQ